MASAAPSRMLCFYSRNAALDAYFKEGHGGWERVIAGIAEEFDLTTSDAADVVDDFKKMENAK